MRREGQHRRREGQHRRRVGQHRREGRNERIVDIHRCVCVCV